MSLYLNHVLSRWTCVVYRHAKSYRKSGDLPLFRLLSRFEIDLLLKREIPCKISAKMVHFKGSYDHFSERIHFCLRVISCFLVKSPDFLWESPDFPKFIFGMYVYTFFTFSIVSIILCNELICDITVIWSCCDGNGASIVHLGLWKFIFNFYDVIFE